MNAIDELIKALEKSGARVTFDRGRDITHPCTFCATPANPHHELVTIGTYPNGDDLTRPVCVKCMTIAEAIKNAKPRPRKPARTRRRK